MDLWLVFGTAEVWIRGNNLHAGDIWAAKLVSVSHPEESVMVVVVSLGIAPQEDQQFDLTGFGTSRGSPLIFGCRNLEISQTTCGLGPTLTVLNEWEGTTSVQLRLASWQTSATFKLRFSSGVALSGLWGARRSRQRGRRRTEIPGHYFRLLPPTAHPSPERRSSFGFSVSPPLDAMPTIECRPTLPLPPPPPQSPPLPPPSPPLFLEVSHDCFLGGRATFTLSPTAAPGVAWEMRVAFDRWKAGITVTIDFLGLMLRERPLRVSRLMLPSAVQLAALTSHSVVVNLQPTPVLSFSLTATGGVEALGRIDCCCADPPPPPPPAPASPPSPRLLPLPMPPPLHSQSSASDGAILGAVTELTADEQAALAAAELERSLRTAWTAKRVLAVTTPLVFLAIVLCALLFSCCDGRNATRQLARLFARTHPKFRGLKLVDDVEHPADACGAATRRTKLHVQAAEPQTLRVARGGREPCGLAGARRGAVRGGGPRLLRDGDAYHRPSGAWGTVTRSVPLETLKKAPALRLTPQLRPTVAS